MSVCCLATKEFDGIVGKLLLKIVCFKRWIHLDTLEPRREAQVENVLFLREKIFNYEVIPLVLDQTLYDNDLLFV